ncbi:SRPBCC family protein [Streptacidiphilus rugosus]|uniref:SRPBCC family protein n=1 Tax=Streptacidiphilus rugosus TaxID=405783 RepID=UPI00068C056B|nr:SRPBCC family protein [Streptacidiphilus rugosus]
MGIRTLLSSGRAIADLHYDYAKRGRLDPDAQVQAVHRLRIEAPVAVVWRLLADIGGWPAWSAGISGVELPGGVAVDQPFRWRNHGHRIDSRIAVVLPEQEISWSGVCGGFLARAVHRQLLVADGGGTLVTAEECMSGPLLPLYYDAEKLRAGLVDWMSELRLAAESAAPAPVSVAAAQAAQDQL